MFVIRSYNLLTSAASIFVALSVVEASMAIRVYFIDDSNPRGRHDGHCQTQAHIALYLLYYLPSNPIAPKISDIRVEERILSSSSSREGKLYNAVALEAMPINH